MIKKVSYLGLIVLLLSFLGFLLSKDFQLARAAEKGDVITRMYVTDKDGKPITGKIAMWSQFRLNADFKLPNGVVKQGDTTTISLPDEITFDSATSFDITDSKGKVVAKAKVDNENKKVLLTYTNYAEHNSDVSGSFFMYVRVDHYKVRQPKHIDLNITINHKRIPGGSFDYEGPTVEKRLVDKSAWKFDGNTRKINYGVAINRAGIDMRNVTVTDTLKSSSLSYDKSSFHIYKVRWYLDAAGQWQKEIKEDVTAKFPIQFNGSSFIIHFGNVSASDGYYIRYTATIDYEPVDGEQFFNDVTLKSSSGQDETKNGGYTFLVAGGKAEGYKYSIKIIKTDEAGRVLSGATFDVIRDKTKKVIKTVTTGADGTAVISNLLKDDYTLKEISAPPGYRKAADVHVSVSDFNTTLKLATKTIIDKKNQIDISGEKTWVDENDQDGKRPQSIIVKLLANGKEVQRKTVTAANQWRYVFTNLEQTDSNGDEIHYTVDEEVVEGYKKEVNGYNITNTHTPERVNVMVTKKWDDNNNVYKLRPRSIKVSLFADEKLEKTVTITPDVSGNWAYTFTDLPKYKKGKLIRYTVSEEQVEGYEKPIYDVDTAAGSITITNKITKRYSLPGTGGRGITTYLLSGFIVVIISTTLLAYKVYKLYRLEE